MRLILGMRGWQLLALGAGFVVLGTGASASFAAKPAGGEGKVTVSDAVVTEGSSGTSSLVFTVQLAGPAKSSATVSYASSNGTASAPDDYAATAGTLTLTKQTRTRTVSVQVVGDTLDESDETLFLLLSNPSGASIADGSGVGTIQDDDGVAYSDEVLADSPVAYWRLGAGATDVDDSSGNGHLLTETGALTEVDGLIASSSDRARDFPGSDTNYYEAADHADFDFTGTASFSIEVWVNLDTVDAGFRRILDHDDLTNGWSLLAETTGGFQFYRHAGGAEALAEYIPISTGVTYHVVGTYDGTDLLLYVNGVLSGGTGTTTSMAATAQGVRTGFGAGAANYPDGRLDELAVYPTALSPERILAHYNAGAGVQG